MHKRHKMKEEICKLLDIADRTYYKWRQEKRPIIQFLTMFDETDLNRFLDNPDDMSKFELIRGKETILHHELVILIGVLSKLELYIQEAKLNREGTLIKFYRTLRDMPVDKKDYKKFLNNYKMDIGEALKNWMVGTSYTEIIEFYDSYLSEKEIGLIRKHKEYILPPLKSMRKHNSHLDD